MFGYFWPLIAYPDCVGCSVRFYFRCGLCLTVTGAAATAARGGGNGGAGMLDVGAALGRMLDRRVDAALHCSLPLARCLRRTDAIGTDRLLAYCLCARLVPS